MEVEIENEVWTAPEEKTAEKVLPSPLAGHCGTSTQTARSEGWRNGGAYSRAFTHAHSSHGCYWWRQTGLNGCY